MPALNEEANVSGAINNTLEAFSKYRVNGEIIVINDGSSDRTAEMVKDQITRHPDSIRLISHEKPKGIGASFWDGVDTAFGDKVCMLPGDNENDPFEILRYAGLLDHVDIAIPFIYNRWARPFFRNILSFAYRLIINTTFIVNFNYTNGTILYRRSILSGIKHRNKDFFFQTDILIRLAKSGYLFAEVPYRIGVRNSGVSKALSFPSLIKVIKGYMVLVKDIYFSKTITMDEKDFTADSMSARRYNSHTRGEKK